MIWMSSSRRLSRTTPEGNKHVRPLRAGARTVWDGPRFRANPRTNVVDAPHEVAHYRPMMHAGRLTRDPTGTGGDNPMRRTEISSRVNQGL